MDSALQDIIKNDRFYSTTRSQAASINYPPIVRVKKIVPSQSENLTNISCLTRIPTKSACRKMKEICDGGHHTISCEIGVVNFQSVHTLLKIHELKEIKFNVLQEEEWIQKDVQVPNKRCFYSRDNLEQYEKLIFEKPDGRCVFKGNPYILASDLSTVAGSRWLHHSILSGVADILQKESTETAVLMLGDVALMSGENRMEYIRRKIKDQVKNIIFIINVGKQESGKVYVGTPNSPGCHWTLLYVQLSTNNWFYCDSKTWRIPEDLQQTVSPIVDDVYEIYTSSKPAFSGIKLGHEESVDVAEHVCSSCCHPNLPLQTCENVCGVVVGTLSAIAVKDPKLWQEVLLGKGAVPEPLKWLLHPTKYSDFLRCVLICWLICESVDLEMLGVQKSHEERKTKNEDDEDDEDEDIGIEQEGGISEDNGEMDSNGQPAFYVGKTFRTVEELDAAKKAYEEDHFCQLWKRDVRTLAAAAKRTPKKVQNADPKVKYYSLRLACKFGGRDSQGKKKGKQKSRSYRKMKCPFEIDIRLSDKGKLQVQRISSQHNHVLEKEIFEDLPRQRKSRQKMFYVRERDIQRNLKKQKVGEEMPESESNFKGQYKEALSTLLALGSLVHEGGPDVFIQRHDVLKAIKQSWEAGKEVAVRQVEKTEEEEETESE